MILSSGPILNNAVTSLGTYGAVTRLTLSCVSTYALKEDLTVLSLKELRAGHEERLKHFKHVKYHYIPYTDRVVVYTYEEVDKQLIGKEGILLN